MDDRLAALRSALPLPPDATITPLDGGITNHNLLVEAGGTRCVLRLAGERTDLLRIDRAVEVACSRAAAAAGVGPEVLAFLPEHGALLTRFLQGRVLAPGDLTQQDALHRVVDALRRFHAVPAVPGGFSPFDVVRDYHDRAHRHGVLFPPEMTGALRLLDAIEGALQSNEPACPCHNDLLPANLIDDGSQVWIIDWEYGGMGDRFFDLGNLAANSHLDPDGEIALLEAYYGRLEAEHLRRLRLMRLASDLRESLWGYLQAGISHLDVDFEAYGHNHLDRFLAGAARAGNLVTEGMLG